ncbi:MAG: VWA domain-containing protein [Bacteroidales bacterium]|nr:VWA domain-containing protein [Bacteroidales bacterium]
MTFAHPWLLLLLLLVPLLIGWWIWRYRRQQPTTGYSSITQFKDAPRTLRQRLYPLLYVLRLVAVALLVIALARPQSKLSRSEMKVEGIDIVLALDVSGSMLAEDFSPNRLEAAKKVAADFVNGRKNDRMGLVVFSGEAFTQVPLTIDHNVLLSTLAKIKSGQLKDGTALGDGLATAINRIKDSKAKSKVIILLTDGVNNMGSVDPQTAADICKLYDIRLYTIGVGKHGMAPYPMQYSVMGHVVTQYQNVPVEIDEKLLTSMAEATNDGCYFRATGKKSLQQIFGQIDQMEKTKIDVAQYNQTKDEFFPFLAAALLCLVSELLLKLLYFKR